MFWKRASGDGAFWGLAAGTGAAALTWLLTVAEGKGGLLGNLHTFPSPMAQNFWIAIVAFATCFIVSVAVSMVTTPRPDKEMEGLVYGLTKVPHDVTAKWYQRPAPLTVAVVIMLIILNIWFR
jgi:SSS family solute:Na+ symporter